MTIKNVPPALHRQLKKLAAAENRSLNAEVIYRLRASISSLPVRTPQSIEAELAAIRALRESIPLRIASDEELTEMKRAGRK